jgi:hypothetical protein
MYYLMNMESMKSVRQTLQLTGKGDWSSFLLQNINKFLPVLYLASPELYLMKMTQE